MVRPFIPVLAALLAGSRGASAEQPTVPAAAAAGDQATTPAVAAGQEPEPEGPIRRRTASLRRVFRGPFQSSRLFAMPTADTIGPYMLSFGGDGSLLQETGVLTSAGVFAIGFGDLAQLEYRHTSAISISGVNAPVPGVGVQLKLPIPDINGVPAIGVSFRLGVPRRESFGATDIDETVTDLYLVGRLRIKQLSWLALHGGTRVSSASIKVSGVSSGDRTAEVTKTLWLPTAGYEIAMNPTAKIVGEIALAPQFRWMPGTDAAPEIGYGLLGRFGMRWAVLPSVVIDGSIGYQLEVANSALASGPDAVVAWDIRLGAEVFVPWGALACRAAGVFCE
ncbi:MAG: hypothetical protein SFX73_24820 [Kofleriaceae bacterium]|nr:hypothetical protein [Kofleriaceae bacterium]